MSFWAERSWPQLARDSLDVFIVYYVVYRLLLLLRGTRAAQVALGLIAVFALYLAAQLLQLVTVITILGALIQSVILVVVVVFQQDIRRVLMRVGSQGRNWLGTHAPARGTRVIDEIVEAVTELARHRIGALITFEQEANLDEFVGSNKGHTVDAAVSQELLVSLFIPEGMNKLHDGAVIIRNLRIAKAGVFFPMPEGSALDQSFGSRHRAAVGITEETDAVVVVVSEERGTVSFCFNGNIVSAVDAATLRETLTRYLAPTSKRARRWPRRRSGAAPESTAKPVQVKAKAKKAKAAGTSAEATSTNGQPASDATSTPLTRVSLEGGSGGPTSVKLRRAEEPAGGSPPAPLRARPSTVPEPTDGPASSRLTAETKPMPKSPPAGADPDEKGKES